MEEEIQSLVETTLTSLSEGGALDAHTKDQLLKEYVRLRNTEQLRERQLSQVKGRMSERMKDRRAKLQSKHQSKRAEVGLLCMCGLPYSGKFSRSAKFRVFRGCLLIRKIKVQTSQYLEDRRTAINRTQSCSVCMQIATRWMQN